MTGYEFEFTMRPAELRRGYRTIRSMRSVARRAIVVLLPIGFGLLLLIEAIRTAFIADVTESSAWWARVVMLGATSIVIITAPFWVNRVVDAWTLLRLRRAGADTLKAQRLALRPDGIFSVSASGEGTIRWNGFSECLSGPDGTIILRLPSHSVIILPARAITDAGHEPARVLADIRAWRAAAPSTEPVCPACGFDFTGATREGCPECGWRRDSAPASP